MKPPSWHKSARPDPGTQAGPVDRGETPAGDPRCRQKGKVYAVYVAFEGDSPVEHEDEDEPTGPEPSSLTQANQPLQGQAKTWNSHSE